MTVSQLWLAVGVTALCVLQPVGTLQLSVVSSSGRSLWSGAVDPGERFEIRFTHSQEHCRWTQHYAVAADSAIEQVASTYPCLGAGAPVEAPRQQLQRTGQGYLFAGGTRWADIQMMNSRAAGITLVYRSRQIRLSEAMAEYERFLLHVHR